MRKLYNQRHGVGPDRAHLTRNEVAQRVCREFEVFCSGGYFQRSWGFECSTDDEVHVGVHGRDWADEIYLNLGIDLGDGARGSMIRALEESDGNLFTVVEFFFDHMARPVEGSGHYHDYPDYCGWHFPVETAEFDIGGGQQEWAEALNKFLRFYGDGYEVTIEGEVRHLPPQGFEPLLVKEVPLHAGEVNRQKMALAIQGFRSGMATRAQRKQAIVELANVLEFYDNDVRKHLLTQDEKDLSHIANKFALRHHNADQRRLRGRVPLVDVLHDALHHPPDDGSGAQAGARGCA